MTCACENLFDWKHWRHLWRQQGALREMREVSSRALSGAASFPLLRACRRQGRPQGSTGAQMRGSRNSELLIQGRMSATVNFDLMSPSAASRMNAPAPSSNTAETIAAAICAFAGIGVTGRVFRARGVDDRSDKLSLIGNDVLDVVWPLRLNGERVHLQRMACIVTAKSGPGTSRRCLGIACWERAMISENDNVPEGLRHQHATTTMVCDSRLTEALSGSFSVVRSWRRILLWQQAALVLILKLLLPPCPGR